MPRKYLEKEKEVGELFKLVTPVLVINKKSLQPFLEMFDFQPENIVQKPLGRLLGMFEIKDFSEESSYVVNFLTSVARKEYYMNSRRIASESLEAALHKVNVALSELVQHGNTNWLGRLDSAICSIEKNLIHFSVTGSARILLIRNGILTDISEGLEPEIDEAHPIKTFVNISSGRLEIGDRIIITTGDIFEIFSPTEIQKSSMRYPDEKFIQFIRTALVNELDIAGTIILEVQEPPAESQPKKKKAPNKDEGVTPNVFSEVAFRKEKSKTVKGSDVPPETKVSSQEKGIEGNKTGHIYLQEDATDLIKEGGWSRFMATVGEKTGDFSLWTKKIAKRIYPILKNKFSSVAELSVEASRKLTNRTRDNVKKISFTKGIEKKSPQEEKNRNIGSGKKTHFSFRILKKFLPDIKRISELAGKLNYFQKIFIIIVLIIVAVAPLIFSKLKKPDKKELKVEPGVPLVMTNNQVLAQDKNINLDSNVSAIADLQNPIRTIFMRDRLFVVNSNVISTIANDQLENNYPFQNGILAENATSMEDLNLIFFTTNNQKVYSFSPVSNEIKTNNISFPAGTRVKALATYLTFLYIVDSQNDMIYRYPRSEGGFGDKVDWLKDQISLQEVNDMAIDDNVYLAQNNQMLKLFKGLQQNFSVESTNTPIVFSRIYTNVDVQNIYILDSPNGRVIKLSKDGLIIRQYYDELLEKAKEFSVDEKNNRAYVITEKNQLAKLEMD